MRYVSLLTKVSVENLAVSGYEGIKLQRAGRRGHQDMSLEVVHDAARYIFNNYPAKMCGIPLHTHPSRIWARFHFNSDLKKQNGVPPVSSTLLRTVN